MLDTMWHFMEMGGLKANYPALKEACMEMRQMIMQKTAGQRKDRPKDIPWENWKRIKIDPDDGEKELCEYTFKHCPECGAKIIIHKSCEFCRWHLRDTTCFNDLEKRPRTTPEDSCWNWEERE